MYRRFLTARSPLRLLEKGLHGGLGQGNLGLVLAGPGVGKTSFLVGVALDELLRNRPVLHVALDHSVQHVRDFYDTVFEELANTTQLSENHVAVRAEMDRLRRIRVYPQGSFDAKRLGEAIALEAELGPRPELVMIDGLDVAQRTAAEMEEWASAARDAKAEVWMAATVSTERIPEMPVELRPLECCFAVILAMEPGEGSVALRALKDHDSSDVSSLHVALDPKTLLLIRS